MIEDASGDGNRVDFDGLERVVSSLQADNGHVGLIHSVEPPEINTCLHIVNFLSQGVVVECVRRTASLNSAGCPNMIPRSQFQPTHYHQCQNADEPKSHKIITSTLSATVVSLPPSVERFHICRSQTVKFQLHHKFISLLLILISVRSRLSLVPAFNSVFLISFSDIRQFSLIVQQPCWYRGRRGVPPLLFVPPTPMTDCRNSPRGCRLLAVEVLHCTSLKRARGLPDVDSASGFLQPLYAWLLHSTCTSDNQPRTVSKLLLSLQPPSLSCGPPTRLASDDPRGRVSLRPLLAACRRLQKKNSGIYARDVAPRRQ